MSINVRAKVCEVGVLLGYVIDFGFGGEFVKCEDVSLALRNTDIQSNYIANKKGEIRGLNGHNVDLIPIITFSECQRRFSVNE